MRGARLNVAAKQSRVAAERELAPLVAVYRKALTAAAREIARRFEALTAAAWQPKPEGELSDEVLAAAGARLAQKLRPLHVRLLRVSSEPIFARAGIAFDVKAPLLAPLLAQVGKRTGTKLGAAVQPVLRDIIAAAYQDGLSVPETAAKIREELTAAASWQADLLARTDLNGLANGGSVAAARTVGVGYKSWEATLDDKTRPAHAEAHGQTVPIEQPFQVDGEPLDYPGDPGGSDENVINCRCAVTYQDSLTAASILGGQGGEMATASAVPVLSNLGSRLAAATPAFRAPAGLTAAAIPFKRTAVIDQPWDGNAAMTRASGAAAYRSICAWVDSSGDAADRASYKFPHHANAGGPANVNGVRNALARLPQASIPAGDVAGVRSHLQKHLDDFNRNRAAVLASATLTRAFTGTATIEGKLSDDNSLTPRVLLADSLGWPEMPVPFMAQTITAEGHDGAEVAGRIDEFKRTRGVGRLRNIQFGGALTTPYGINEIAPMIADSTLRFVSVDLGATEWALINRASFAEVPEEELNIEDLQAGSYALGLKSGKIKAVTLVPTQAIEGATVSLVASADGREATLTFPVEMWFEREALLASAAPAVPPRAWFETAEPSGKMPLTITDEGRIFGHIASWDTCHIGFQHACEKAQPSPSHYAYFHVGEIEVSDGSKIAIGKLMLASKGGKHADISASRVEAARHYDDTSMVAGYLRATDGRYGVWVAGAVNPALSEQRLRELRTLPPSGDWRIVNGQRELVAALAVPVPGFPIPRSEFVVVASGDMVELGALVATAGEFSADPAAIRALTAAGLLEANDEEARTRALLARAEGGIDGLLALAEA